MSRIRGDSTRCPNRPFLIRTIRESLAHAPVMTIGDAPAPALFNEGDDDTIDAQKTVLADR